jgi:hypothetical protein
MFAKHKPPPRPADAQRFPMLALWFQIRSAIADVITPLLAGLKTVWLLIFTPFYFFRAYFFGERPLERLHSPFGPLWRTLSDQPQKPLDPAQFLLFAILTAALAGFNFDNSNRLTGLLQETGVVERSLAQLSGLNPAAGDLVERVQTLLQTPIVASFRTFFDQSLIAAIVELFVNLLILIAFAYLFWLFSGRHVSVGNSYVFWLYTAGLQYFTTAVTSLFFSIVSLDLFNLPTQVPAVIFWLSDTGLRLLWQYVLPALILPRLFPPLTAGRVFLAALIGRAILALIGWLIAGGLLALLAFLATLTT